MYGKRDADAALVWARSTGLPENLVGVLRGIATADAERAFDVLKTLPLNSRSEAMQMIASEAGNDRSSDPGRIAEQLLGNDDPNFGSAMNNLLSSWSSWSPPNAVAWMMSHSDRLPPVAFRQVAMNLGSNDSSAGEQYLAQLPSEARFAWIQGLAEGRAQADPRAAVAWVERLRNDPAYVAAAASVAQGLARIDPQAAGDLLARIDNISASDAQALSMAAYNIGATWARTNPRAAADWARDLRADAWRYGGLPPIIAAWAESDYSAAHSWTMQLPAGKTRDGALGSLLIVSTNDEPDAALLRAFSSDETRQNSLLGAVGRVAQRNPDAARTMSQRYLTGPPRQQAEQMIASIENQRRTGGMMFFSN
jgi:hypothetical protein